MRPHVCNVECHSIIEVSFNSNIACRFFGKEIWPDGAWVCLIVCSDFERHSIVVGLLCVSLLV